MQWLEILWECVCVVMTTRCNCLLFESIAVEFVNWSLTVSYITHIALTVYSFPLKWPVASITLDDDRRPSRIPPVDVAVVLATELEWTYCFALTLQLGNCVRNIVFGFMYTRMFVWIHSFNRLIDGLVFDWIWRGKMGWGRSFGKFKWMKNEISRYELECELHSLNRIKKTKEKI